MWLVISYFTKFTASNVIGYIFDSVLVQINKKETSYNFINVQTNLKYTNVLRQKIILVFNSPKDII